MRFQSIRSVEQTEQKFRRIRVCLKAKHTSWCYIYGSKSAVFKICVERFHEKLLFSNLNKTQYSSGITSKVGYSASLRIVSQKFG